MCNITTALALSATVLGSIVITPHEAKALTLIDYDTNMTVDLGSGVGDFTVTTTTAIYASKAVTASMPNTTPSKPTVATQVKLALVEPTSITESLKPSCTCILMVQSLATQNAPRLV